MTGALTGTASHCHGLQALPTEQLSGLRRAPPADAPARSINARDGLGRAAQHGQVPVEAFERAPELLVGGERTAHSHEASDALDAQRVRGALGCVVAPHVDAIDALSRRANTGQNTQQGVDGRAACPGAARASRPTGGAATAESRSTAAGHAGAAEAADPSAGTSRRSAASNDAATYANAGADVRANTAGPRRDAPRRQGRRGRASCAPPAPGGQENLPVERRPTAAGVSEQNRCAECKDPKPKHGSSLGRSRPTPRRHRKGYQDRKSVV